MPAKIRIRNVIRDPTSLMLAGSLTLLGQLGVRNITGGTGSSPNNLASSDYLASNDVLLASASDTSSSSLTAHPRIWLTSEIIADITAKKNANDAEWLTLKAQADTSLTAILPGATIVSISNSNPAVITIAETVPFPAQYTVYGAGGTGAWAALNTTVLNGGYTPFVVTRTGVHTFSVQTYAGTGSLHNLDSTAFGSYAGQTINLFLFDGGSQYATTSGYSTWGQYGGGYWEDMLYSALVYKITGTTSYRDKALAVLDFMNTFGAAGNDGPQSIDSGRAGTLNTYSLAVVYDWLYADLSTAQKTATYITLNHWANWTLNGNADGSGPAYGIGAADSNYWEAAHTFIGAVYYATADENPSASTWLSWLNTAWTNSFVPTFDAPSTTIEGDASLAKGSYYGGQNWLGYNYGGNDVGRHLKFFEMVRTATGTEPPNATTYAKLWAGTTIHELKPDRYKSVSWGRWPATYSGVFNRTEAMMLAYYLRGTTEGGWAQWQYQHIDYATPGINEGLTTVPSVIDKVMFYKPSRTQVDYTATEVPYKFVDGAQATLHWRSGWDTAADFAYFRMSQGNISVGEIVKDAGHVDITRGTDGVLVQSNRRKGTTDGVAGEPEYDFFDTSMSNTLYFFDGGYNGSTQWCFTQGIGSAYDGCQLFYGVYKPGITRLTSAYGFGEADLAGAYHYTGVPQSAWSLNYWFRAFTALGNGVYVIFDRVKSTSAAHTKHFNWHFPGTTAPTLAGGAATLTFNTSKIGLTSVLPASRTLTAVQNPNGGNWRVEIADASPAQTLNGLTVACAKSSSASLPAVTGIATIDANFAGVEIADTTPKVFVGGLGVTSLGGGDFQSTSYTSSSFTTTHSGTGTYVIKGLAAGVYLIAKGGTAQTTVSVLTDGTTSFTSTSGAFTVSLLSSDDNPLPINGHSTRMISPAPGETFIAPAELRLVANAEDLGQFGGPFGTDHRAQSVEFFANSTLIATVGFLTTPEFSVFKTRVTGLTAGSYDIWCRAHFIDGSTLDSLHFPITVSAAPTYGTTINLAADRDILASPITVGTSGSRVRVNGNGFKLTGSGPSALSLQYVDFYNLGASAGVSHVYGLDVTTTGTVLVDNCRFDGCTPLRITSNVSGTVAYTNNLHRSNSRNPLGQYPIPTVSDDNYDSYPCLELGGSSTGLKVYEGNNTGAGWVIFSSANWTVGGNTNAKSNVLMGPRVGLFGNGAFSGTVVRNFCYHIYNGGWSQGSAFEYAGTTSLIEHNVVMGSSWPVRGIDGTFRYNLVIPPRGQEGAIWSSSLPADIHHNICILRQGTRGALYQAFSAANPKFRNNTVDAITTSDPGDTLADMLNGTMTLNSNLFLRSGATNVVNINANPSGNLTADYNAFYDVTGAHYSDGRVPAHDKTGNPLLAAPPSQIIPFSLSAVWQRLTTVTSLLTTYRNYYTPSAVVVDAGDTSVYGSGNDIGAVGAGASNAFDLFGTLT